MMGPWTTVLRSVRLSSAFSSATTAGAGRTSTARTPARTHVRRRRALPPTASPARVRTCAAACAAASSPSYFAATAERRQDWDAARACAPWALRGHPSHGVRRAAFSSSASAPAEEQTYATDVRFDDADLGLDPHSQQAVAGMGLTHMTEIQAKTFAAGAAGHDVLGRARTGTGKTVAFLLPAIERLARDGALTDPARVGLLVLSPTRELASQIGQEAVKLLRHHRGATMQVMFGGTNAKMDVQRLSGRGGLPTVLVATPGRLLDHLKTTRLGNASFGDVMSQTKLVVLDETDRLLDMGFRRDIESILGYLAPSRARQTLLFSATMPPALKDIMRTHMKPDYVEVDCIQDGDAATHTNDRVAQAHVVLPKGGLDPVTAVVETVRYAVETHVAAGVPPKIVLFFPTARLVQFYAQVFETIQGGVVLEDGGVDGGPLRLQAWELHSKKNQGYRNRVSEEFRQAATGVLFTSDVSARGVDYPNVSHVVQFGLPDSREQYVHRLGRTGRAGAKGKGWLVLQDWEAPFLQELEGVAVPADAGLRDRLAAGAVSEGSRALVQEATRRVRGGVEDGVLAKSGSAAYAAFLGYYKGQMKRLGLGRAERLVGIANDFAAAAGFLDPPELQASTVGKMGLKGVAGLNIGSGGFGGGRVGGGRTGQGGGGGGRGGRGGGGGGRGGRGRR